MGHLYSISAIQRAWVQEVLNSYVVDPFTQSLLEELAITSPNSKGFLLSHGLIKKADKIWIGANSALQIKLIAAFHSSVIGGHSGVQATYQRVRKLFAWQGLKKSVEEFVQQCTIYQQAKHEHCSYPGLLQPLQIPSGAWQDISLDFVEGLPTSKGHVILVVVDRFTKFAHFLPLKHPFSAVQVAELFLTHVASLYGMPKSLVSDRDQVFTSTFWQTLFKRFEVPLHLSTTYHPQSDGQTERMNQCLEMYLRCAVSSTPRQWCAWLPLAQFWYNTSYHSALQCSPYKALFGTDLSYGLLPPLTESAFDTSVSDSLEVDALLKERALFSSLLKHHLICAQNRMKQTADVKRTPRSFQVGDLVLLKLQPYAQHSVVARPFPKLAFKYFWPFPITAKVGSVAYRLELPEHSGIHPIFHISQLKQFVLDVKPVFSSLPSPVQLDVAELLPSEILDRRMVKKGNVTVVQVLVRWGSLAPELAAWEDHDVLKARFPDAAA